MTTSERAKKTVRIIKEFPKGEFRTWEEMEEIIAAQIEEAERYADLDGFKKGVKKGFAAAKEQARQIAETYWNWEPKNHHISRLTNEEIAERISNMSPTDESPLMKPGEGKQ